LNLLSLGLTENNVNHALLLNKRTFHENLKEFKTSVDVNVLLIPMASGSYGLNITEATNVLFVEPSLNIAREIQAISRVHRLGQTRY
jgi:E3 ubiquitin-protein ligase SHPRH